MKTFAEKMVAALQSLASNIKITEMVFGFIFSVAYCVGRTICENHDFSGITSRPVFYAVMFLALMTAAAFVLPLLYYVLGCVPLKLFSKKWIWPIAGVILWVVYMFCFVSYYPGVFRYDVVLQTEQALGVTAFSNFQPVLHTVIWKLFLAVESVLTGGSMGGNIALVLYSVVQLAIVVALSTYASYRAYCLGGEAFGLLGLLYYLCVPTLHVFSFIMTKDVYFTCCTTLFLMCVYEIGNGRATGRTKLGCVFWGLLATLLRNNMVYAVIVGACTALFLKLGRKLGVWLFAVVLLNFVVTSFLYPALGIQGTKVAEALSVPISQVAYVYDNHYEELDGDEISCIETYIDQPQMYNPRIADFVKSSFNNDWYGTDSKSFWKCYFSLMKRYPMEYITVFLDLNVNLWYLDAPFPDVYSNREYIETGLKYTPLYEVTQGSRFYWLHAQYEKFASFSSSVMRLPVVRWYFSLGFSFVFLLFCMYCAVKNMQIKACTECHEKTDAKDVGKTRMKAYAGCGAMVVVLTLVALFAGYLLGPVGIYRYMYVFYFMMPWLLALSLKQMVALNESDATG